MMRIALLLAVSLLALSSVAAQSPAAADSTAPLTGSWEGSFNHEGSVWRVAMILKQTDTTVTGTLYKDGDEYGEVRGSIHGTSWVLHWDQIGISGTLEGDRLRVELTVYNGTKYHFSMTRRAGS
jgi:hypothetical protein